MREKSKELLKNLLVERKLFLNQNVFLAIDLYCELNDIDQYKFMDKLFQTQKNTRVWGLSAEELTALIDKIFETEGE